MKYILVLLTFFLTSCATIPASYRDLAQKLQNSSVQLADNGRAFCSGVVIATNRVLTNHHCVSVYVEGEIIFKDKSKKNYKILKLGTMVPDLALLEVETSVKPVKFGEMPLTGDIIFAMGSPFGLGWTFTMGVVSNPEVDLKNPWTDESHGIFIQHDVLLNPGSSGSGLFNIRGELIGLNARGGNGIGFSVPITQIKEFLEGTDAVPA